MLTICYSYGGNCPCLKCDKQCCIQSEQFEKTDTEKLCDKAKQYCEKCALENKQEGEE